MRLRSSTEGRRRQTSPPRCPVMRRPPRLPPGATPAACAGAAVAAAPGMKSGGGHGGPRGRAGRSPSPAARSGLVADACSATPSPEEVQSWAQSFDKLMRSPAGRGAFRAFLRTEYSEENMLFWLACEELKAEADRHAVDEKARLIYEDYVSILSPKEVSLDSRVREGINKKMQEPSAHTFDDAQLQIYTLMHRDSYPRFLTSPAYRALLLQGGSPSSTEA
uniref:Regulator of G protein signaling 19 n=3 Tax=Sus scrofa TaxID=9823 RepID=A0A8D0ZHT2_PIG